MLHYKYYNMSKRNTTVVRKIGGSLGIIIPIEILRAHGLQRGDEVEILHGTSGIIHLSKIKTIT